jgi:hypothetical protein
MDSKLVELIIRENHGIMYSAKIYEDSDNHRVDYYKNDQLIETRIFEEKQVERTRAAVSSWLDNIKVLKS